MRSLQQEVFEALVGSRDRLVIEFDEIAEKALDGSVGEIARAEAFFGRGSSDIGRQVTRVLPRGWTCQISASFVHGSQFDGPDGRYIVKPTSKRHKSCEIGDLLVAVEHVLPGGSVRSALLIQAKKAAARTDKPWQGGGDSGDRQRALFADLPTFTWKEPKVYFRPDPPERTLVPEAVDCYCGARFKIWGDSHWSRWPRDGEPSFHGGAVFATLLDSPLVVPPVDGRRPRPLAAVLADMLIFTGGWEFDRLSDSFADTAEPRGWSAVIWELLLRSAMNEHRRSRTTGDARIFDPDRDQVRFTDEEEIGWPERNEDDDDEGRGGIAVVRMKVDGRERDSESTSL